MTHDKPTPVTEVETVLAGAAAPVLAETVKAAHRARLHEAVAAAPTPASAPPPRRRRTLAGVAVGTVVLAGGAGLAVAYVEHSAPEVTDIVRCFATTTSDYGDESLFVDTMLAGGPQDTTPANSAAHAQEMCASMWERGTLSTTPPHIRDDQPTGELAPPLQACVLPDGWVGVFPDSDACLQLGLPQAKL